MRITVVLAFALCACKPNFDTITEACPKHIPGDGQSEADAVEVFTRVGCYRRFAKMTTASIAPEISDAARAHARYVTDNGPEDYPLMEDSNKPSFTGVDPIERVVAQGYDVGESNPYATIGFWEGVFLNDPSFDPTDIADGWMWGHFTRQGILQPAWRDGGYGTTDQYAVITILYDFPAPEASERPVAWPRDGQTNVPPLWLYSFPDDLFPLFSEVGYPITFTVGSDVDESAITADNPYDINLIEAVLTGPDGDVDHTTVTPETTPYDFPYTVALIPDQPLAENTTYTATVRLRWNSRNSAGDFTTTFTTGANEIDEASRRVPEPLQVSWREPGGVLHSWRP